MRADLELDYCDCPEANDQSEWECKRYKDHKQSPMIAGTEAAHGAAARTDAAVPPGDEARVAIRLPDCSGVKGACGIHDGA